MTGDPRGASEAVELVDELVRTRQFLTTTAQTDTPLYRCIDEALATMDLAHLREAAEWAARLGWP
jgi:hypothetical protein